MPTHKPFTQWMLEGFCGETVHWGSPAGGGWEAPIPNPALTAPNTGAFSGAAHQTATPPPEGI